MPDNPFKDFGKSVSLVSIAQRPSFAVELRTLYDVRGKPVECAKVYDEAIAASLVTKPISPETIDLWSFESPLKKEFVTQETVIEIPGSFRAITCSVCEGTGNWTCQVCTGSTTVTCPDCTAGKIPCAKCIGRGKIPCSYCRGKGFTPGPPKD